ncbi:MAG: hypothetical protein ACTSRZ_18895 [Promethearchaeota archaeon]
MVKDYYGWSLWTELMLGDKLWVKSLDLENEIEDEFVPDVNCWSLVFSKLRKVLKESGLERKTGGCFHTSMNIPLILKNVGLENELKKAIQLIKKEIDFQFGMHSSFTKNDIILNKNYPNVLKKDLELCSILNGVTIVEHPPEYIKKKQIKLMVDELTSPQIIQLLKTNEIILSWENMSGNKLMGNLKNLIEFRNMLKDKLEEIGEKDLINRHLFCLDTGHLLLWRSHYFTGKWFADKIIEEALPEFSKYINVFHIHGNDGRKDNHCVPFSLEFFNHDSRKGINKKKFLENSKIVLNWLKICEEYKKSSFVESRHIHLEALKLPFSLNQFIEFGKLIAQILR